MAETIKGISVVISGDTTGLSKALADVNKKTRDAQSELRQVEKLLQFDPSNTELLAQKQQLLGNAIGSTQEKLNRLRAVQQQVNDQFARGDITEGQYRAFQREIQKTEGELQRLNGELDDTTGEIRQQGRQVSKLGQDYKEAFENARQAMGNTFDQLKRVGAGVTAAGAAIAGGLGAAVKTASDFEQGMANVYSVMAPEDVAKFRDELQQLAIEMGSKTKYSATEAAAGIEELVKAGVSVQDIMNGGISGALSLATAGELELADAAEIASTALNAFRSDNLTVAQAADILAGAANASATSVGELKFSLSQSAAVASAVGLSFEDTATALAVFAQNGLKGSDAGTSLKTMLMRLQPSTNETFEAFDDLNLFTVETAKAMQYLAQQGIKPANDSLDAMIIALANHYASMDKAKVVTGKYFDQARETLMANNLLYSSFYDSSGSLKSFSEIAGILQDKMSGLNDMQRQAYMTTLFGSDAVRASSIAFKEGAKGVDAMAEAMGKISADDVAAQKMQSLQGSITALKSALETAAISIGMNFIPALTEASKQVQGFVSAFVGLSPAQQQMIAFGAAAVAALGLIVGPLLMLIGFIPQIAAGFAAIAPVFAALTGPIGLIVAGIAAFAAGLVYLYQTSEGVRNTLNGVWESIKAAALMAWGAISSFILAQIEKIKTFWAENGSQILQAVENVFNGIMAVVKFVMPAVKFLISTVWDAIKGIIRGALDVIMGAIKIFAGLFTGDWSKMWEGIKQVIGGAVDLILGIMTLNFVGGIRSLLTNLAKGAISIIKGMAEGLAGGFKSMASSLTGIASKIASAVVDFFSKLASDSIAVFQRLRALGASVWNALTEAIRAAVTSIVSSVKSSFTGMISSIKSIFGKVKSTIEDIWNGVVSFFKGIDLKEIGKNIIQGLINGIAAKVNEVKQKAADLAEDVKSAFTGVLKIFSPSRVFKGYGVNIGQGLVNGIDSMKGAAGQASANLAKISSSAAAKEVEKAKKAQEKAAKEKQKAADKAKREAEKRAKAAVTAQNKAFTGALNTAQYNFKVGKVDTSGLIKSLQAVRSNYAKTTEQIQKVNLAIASAQGKQVKQAAAAEKKKFDDSISYIDSRKQANLISTDQELELYEKLQKRYKLGTDERTKIDKKINELSAQLRKEDYDTSVAWIERKKKANELSLTAELSAYERLQARYKAGTDERIAAEEAAAQVRQQIYDQLQQANEEYLSGVKEINEQLISEEQRLNDAYQSAVDQRTAAITGFKGIFDAIAEEAEVSGQDLLKNLQDQVDYVGKWSADLQRLTARGVDGGLLESLRQLGPNAAPEIAALTTLTDAELTKYTELWRKKNEQARGIAVSELGGMREDTDKQIQQLRTDAEKRLDELKATFETKIGEIRTGATDEFSAMKSTLPEIGKQAIQGLIDGMSAMQGGVVEKARVIAQSAAAAMRKALDIHSPSRETTWIGQMIGAGLAAGIAGSVTDVEARAADMAARATAALQKISGPAPGARTTSGGAAAAAGCGAAAAGGITIQFTGPISVRNDQDLVYISRSLGDQATAALRAKGLV